MLKMQDQCLTSSRESNLRVDLSKRVDIKEIALLNRKASKRKVD
jgi:hypothetical protein